MGPPRAGKAPSIPGVGPDPYTGCSGAGHLYFSRGVGIGVGAGAEAIAPVPCNWGGGKGCEAVLEQEVMLGLQGPLSPQASKSGWLGTGPIRPSYPCLATQAWVQC